MVDVEELRRLRVAAYPGRWYYEDYSDDVWELYAENIHDGMVLHPLKILKAAKQGGPYANWWPRKEEAEYLCAAVNALPGLLTELEQLRSHLEKEPRLGLAVVQLTSEVADLQDQLTSLRQAAAAVTEAWKDHDPELHRHVMALARVLKEKP